MLRIAIILLALSGTVQAQETREIRVATWPMDVPCSALTHKSDDTWVLASIVVSPDGSRHYPNPDPDSYDNRMIAKMLAPRCKTDFGGYRDSTSK